MILDEVINVLLGNIESIGEWFLGNLPRLLYSLIAIVIGYALQRFLVNRITQLDQNNRINEHLANTLTKIIKWGITLVVLSIILVQFGITSAMISGFMTLLGGTIVGFAAINTLGNAIAGLIIMTSKPFRVGDRILFNERYSDVLSINLIYTKLLTFDYVTVSVPNQNMIKSEIENFGKKRIIRLRTAITAGYEHEAGFVRDVLLEASGLVDGVIDAPGSYVRVTEFKDYAVEYTLFTFIDEVKRFREIEADLRETVFHKCREYGIDLSTPALIVAQTNLYDGKLSSNDQV